MCGIAGIYSINGEPIKNAEERMSRMLALQRHRGPDAEGFTLSRDKRLILGNLRLSIVAPDQKIPLPFEKPQSHEMLSFNGEIYNFRLTRSQLSNLGCNFVTQSDTEVLFEALKYYKENYFKHIDGMWAFAFYNPNTKKLILNRDCLGERHLFYYINGDELVFASDPKSIIAVIESPEIDYETIPAIWMYNTAPPGKTLIKGLKRLLPGQTLIATDDKINFKITTILKPSNWFSFFNNEPSIEEISYTFCALFQNSIKMRTPDEVKFISTLSGGIDSTLVNLFLTKNTRNFNAVHGISSHSPFKKSEDTFSEEETAAFTAQKLDLNFIKFNMFDLNPVEELLDAAKDNFDGCIDDGVVPFGMIAKIASMLDAKVAIISDGPDEFCGGYPIDSRLHKVDQLTHGSQFKLSLFQLIDRLGTFGHYLCRNLGLQDIPQDMSYNPFRSPVIHQIHNENHIKQLFNHNACKNLNSHFGTIPEYYNAEISSNHDINRSLSYAARTTPDMFNLRIDKAFMKYSIEARLPFQEKNLVEFLIALPSYLKFGSGNSSKYLLRKIVRDRLGNTISQRQKYGFAHHLWHDDKIYEKLEMENTIRKSSFFENDIFSKNFIPKVNAANSHRGMKWNAFCLAQTYKHIKEINLNS